jgi:hypothetical protein
MGSSHFLSSEPDTCCVDVDPADCDPARQWIGRRATACHPARQSTGRELSTEKSAKTVTWKRCPSGADVKQQCHPGSQTQPALHALPPCERERLDQERYRDQSQAMTQGQHAPMTTAGTIKCERENPTTQGGPLRGPWPRCRHPATSRRSLRCGWMRMFCHLPRKRYAPHWLVVSARDTPEADRSETDSNLALDMPASGHPGTGQ